MTELNRLSWPASTVDEAKHPNPDLLVAGIRGPSELHLDRSLLYAGSIDETVQADLVELVDPLGGDRLQGKLDQSPDAILDQDQDRLRHRV